MQASETDNIPGIAPLLDASEEDISRREVSHVFYCMQCDLQFQVDMAVISQKGSQEIGVGIMRIRLDPHLKLERAE